MNNPRGRLVCLYLVCPLVISREVPGEGLFVLNHTHAQVDAEGRVELGSIVGGGKEFSVGVSPSPPYLPSHFSHTLTFIPHSHLTLIHLHPLPTSWTTPRWTSLVPRLLIFSYEPPGYEASLPLAPLSKLPGDRLH